MVCALHIKPLFLPVGIQHNYGSVHADSSILPGRRDVCASSVVTELRQRYYVATYALDTAGNAMPCHHTGYDRHDIHIL